jgi:PrtD family type I secretion system ABC transporter
VTDGKNDLKNALSACRGAIIATIIFSFFISLAMLTVPMYMLQIYDRVISSNSEETLVMMTLIAGFFLFVYGLLEMIRARVMVRSGARFDALLKGRVFSAIFENSLKRPEAAHTQAIRDLDTLRQFLGGNGLFSILDAPWAPMFLFIIFLLHPWLGALAIGGAILLLIISIANAASTNKPLKQAGQHNIHALKMAESTLGNAEVLKAMGMLPAIQARWYKERNNMLGYQAQASDRAGYFSAATKFMRMSMQILVLGTGAWLALNKLITPGVMITAAILLSRALAPVEQIVGNWQNIINARIAYNRLSTLLQHSPTEKEQLQLPPPEGHLLVENLLAAPPGVTKPLLKNISFRLSPGQTLGIIGPSASGKSTLARLLVGVWPCLSGSVRLDNADIYKWNHDDLGPHIGYLPQDVELFSGTFAENICRFGEIDSETIIAAAKIAGVHEMILRMPQGYDTPVGENGRALSGGQRQRVALARAVYNRPALLVLDEPNASLDNEGEIALLNAIASLKQSGSTIIIIAHKPSIMVHMDFVLVLQDGVITKIGPSKDVMPQFIPQTSQLTQA